MATLLKADKGLVFASCIFNKKFFSLEKVQEIWSARFKVSGLVEPEFNPSLKYYSKEMGQDLARIILWSNEQFERDELVEGKLWAAKIENDFSQSGNRTINMDIGLLLKEQLLLSTSKPYSHRIYLRDGVYAELTYKYENKSYQFLPWTYPDYQYEEKVKLFNSLRLGLFSK